MLVKHRPEEVILRAKNLWFSYGAEPVLRDVSLDVRRGELIGIAGPNGAGKTTFLKVLVGLLHPQKGSVSFTCNLEDCANGSPCRPCIGYVPQQPLLREQHFPVTVREVVAMGMYGQVGLFSRLGSREEEAIDRSIREAGLSTVAGEIFSDLSGGQQQRVLIARALVGNPHVLALDEPTSGVDARGKHEFYSLLSHLHSTHNMAVLIILHDLPDLTEKVDRLLFLQHSVLYDGPTRSLGPDGLWKLMVKASSVA